MYFHVECPTCKGQAVAEATDDAVPVRPLVRSAVNIDWSTPGGTGVCDACGHRGLPIGLIADRARIDVRHLGFKGRRARLLEKLELYAAAAPDAALVLYAQDLADLRRSAATALDLSRFVLVLAGRELRALESLEVAP